MLSQMYPSEIESKDYPKAKTKMQELSESRMVSNIQIHVAEKRSGP